MFEVTQLIRTAFIYVSSKRKINTLLLEYHKIKTRTHAQNASEVLHFNFMQII